MKAARRKYADLGSEEEEEEEEENSWTHYSQDTRMLKFITKINNPLRWYTCAAIVACAVVISVSMLLFVAFDHHVLFLVLLTNLPMLCLCLRRFYLKHSSRWTANPISTPDYVLAIVGLFGGFLGGIHMFFMVRRGRLLLCEFVFVLCFISLSMGLFGLAFLVTLLLAHLVQTVVIKFTRKYGGKKMRFGNFPRMLMVRRCSHHSRSRLLKELPWSLLKELREF
mmetsp:Transcript_36518/g.41624  ORF Transcript_36518/g.41624 Transcript_36518/m.41624 type:complete len:224 (-) Transcript_36518:145-816(-)